MESDWRQRVSCNKLVAVVGAAPGDGVLEEIVGKKVLLVEDEAELLQLFGTELQEKGYEVLPASSGAQALELIRGQASGIHLLIADVVLPQVSGIALAHKLKKRSPDAAVLLMSGYGQILHDDVGFPVLAKPLDTDLLLEKVEALIGTPDR